MYRLDDIYHASRCIIAGSVPRELPDTESPTFNTVWKSFLVSARDDVGFYASLWKAVAAKIYNMQPSLLDAKAIREATHHVATSYVMAALHSALKQGDALIAPASRDLAPMLLAIAGSALKLRQSSLPGVNGKLPSDVRAALGEYYSVSIFTLQQLRPHVDADAFHDGIGEMIKDFNTIIAMYDLPHLLHSDDRIKRAQAPEGTIPLPTRSGVVANTGDTARIFQLKAFRKTVQRRDI